MLKDDQCKELIKNNRKLEADNKELRGECERQRQTISQLRSEVEILKQYVPGNNGGSGVGREVGLVRNGLSLIEEESKDSL
jgi:predicted RNase H-like nuclease (RuvC/YqgF family)